MSANDMNATAQEQVRSYVRRALRLNEDMDEVRTDLKELFKEAKGNGYDAAILRRVVARARKDPAKLAEADALLELYESCTQGDLFAPSDLKVSISAGDLKVETTAAAMQAAADAMPKGRKGPRADT